MATPLAQDARANRMEKSAVAHYVCDKALCERKAQMSGFRIQRSVLIEFVAYAALTGALALAIRALPDLYLAIVLNTLLCLGIAVTLLFLRPSGFALVFAPSVILLTFLVLHEANRQKSDITAFPLTAIDLKMFAVNPSGLLTSIGAPDWSYAAIYLFPAGLGIFAAWWGRRFFKTFEQSLLVRNGVVFVLRLIFAGAAIVLLYTSALAKVTDYLDAYKHKLGIWEPDGLVELARQVGVMGFLVYSHQIEASERDFFLTYTPDSPPPPPAEIEKSVETYVQVSRLLPDRRPNIVVVHAESTFDPNDVLRLARPVSNSLFFTHPGDSSDPMVHVSGPALTNIIGGGSWVSEFEVILGLDSRLFGVAGHFTHASLSQYSRNTFPRYLRDRGYSTSAYTNVHGEFYHYEQGYLNYGFEDFYDWDALGPVYGDTGLMTAALGIQPEDPSAPVFKFILLGENHAPHYCLDEWMDEYEDVELVGDASEKHICAVKEYLRRARSTEQAVNIARAYLEDEKQRTGRDYVLAIYGDHQPYTFAGGGGKRNNLGLNFDDYRLDDSKRRTLIKFISSLPNPLTCCGTDPVPLTIFPSLLSSYVAESASALYLPASFYQLDHCGGDWIGHLVGTTFYGKDETEHPLGCDAFESLVAAYQQSDVLGNPESAPVIAVSADPDAPVIAEAQVADTCLEGSGITSVVVAASGTTYGNAPRFRLLADGVHVGDASVDQAPDNSLAEVTQEEILAAERRFHFDIQIDEDTEILSVQFLNDRWAGADETGDTDLWIRYVQVGNTLFLSDNFQFDETTAPRGKFFGNWFRYSTNGVMSISLADLRCAAETADASASADIGTE